MPAQVEAPDTPPGLQHKSAVTAEPIVATNDDTGEVTAVVSVTNVVDDVGDVILPGAYTATLAKRRPKGVWSHSWKDWVARTEEIREYPPGDPQLKALLDEANATLPPEAGALVVRCKFNMRDPDSAKAYEKVKFFSETNECQWSIGYSVPPGKGVRDSKGIRKISGLDLFEYSPVLFGAASQSTSLSVKSADPAQWPEESAADPGAGEIDWDEIEPVALAAVEADDFDETAVAELPADETGPAEEQPADLDSSGDEPVADSEPADAVASETTEPAPEVKSGTEDDPFAAAVRERLGDEVEVKYDTSPVGEPGGRQNWVDKAGGLPPFARAIAHALIRQGKSKSQAIQIAIGTCRRWASGGGNVTEKTRAKAAEVVSWWESNTGAGKDAEPAAVETAAVDEPETTTGPMLLTKWDPAAEIGECAACIPTPQQPIGTRVPVEAKDVPHLPGTQEERRELLRLAVTELLADEEEKSESGYRPWVGIDGTWDDQIVVTVYQRDEKDNQTWRVPYSFEDSAEAGVGAVVLGNPEPVRLSLALEPDSDPAEMDLPPVLMDSIGSATVAAKVLAVGPEQKAGRVLSGANATRIASAVESLIGVLRSAGVEINVPAAGPAPAEAKATPAAEPEGVEIDPAELLAQAAELRVLALRT